MIIVLFAGKAEAIRSIYGYAMSQHRGLLDYVNLGTTDSESVRLKHASSTGDMFSEHRVTFMFNPQSSQELQRLRERKAIICHQYGSNLSRAIYSDINCAIGDLYFTEETKHKRLPGHVLTPDEVLSECRIKHRSNRISVKSRR